jgi:hypothetical protein
MTSTVCWKTRPCSPEVQEACKHAVTDFDMCPSRCTFAFCQLESHVLTTDPALVFDHTVDRSAALKQTCLYCEFFLKNGPRKPAKAGEE